MPEHRSATAYGLMTMVQSVDAVVGALVKRRAARYHGGLYRQHAAVCWLWLVSTLVALLRTRPWRRV